jgi:death on curing protein
VEQLTIDDLVAIAALVLDLDQATMLQATKLGLLDSALHAPFAGYGDMDLYQETWRKCAVLGSRLVRNHPFPDGNKRVAFLAMRAFARTNGFDWSPSNAAGPIIENLAANIIDEDAFAEWVHENWLPA